MDEIELPLVEAATTLKQALKIMKAEKRSGLVTIISDQLAVLDLDQVLEELRERGDGPLSGLSPAKRTGMFTPKSPGAPVVRGTTGIPRQSFVPPTPLPGADLFSIESAHRTLDYLVQAGHGGTLIRIVTRSETLKIALEAPPVVCECSLGHQYSLEQTRARSNKCTKCQDSKPIVCDGGN